MEEKSGAKRDLREDKPVVTEGKGNGRGTQEWRVKKYKLLCIK